MGKKVIALFNTFHNLPYIDDDENNYPYVFLHITAMVWFGLGTKRTWLRLGHSPIEVFSAPSKD